MGDKDKTEGAEPEKGTDWKFPHSWDKCPVCGCKETVDGKVKAEEVANGKMGKDYEVYQFAQKAVIMDVTRPRPPLRVPMVTAVYDICANCGILRCVKVVKQEEFFTSLFPQPGRRN